MAENSKIEWTDHTVNLWWGCSKVHTGCKNCYAEYQSDKMKRGMKDGSKLWGVNSNRREIKSAFNDLDKYQKQAESQGVYLNIFCGSMMDIMEESKPLVSRFGEALGLNTADLRNELFERILTNRYENLIFLFLTKRPENIYTYVPTDLRYKSNCWFGTSISNADTVRYGSVLAETDVKNRFLSIEPQVGRISHNDLGSLLHSIGWVIQGGESGSGKRPFDISWAYEMKEVCEIYNTPYFFKQIDKIKKIPDDLMIRELPQFI